MVATRILPSLILIIFAPVLLSGCDEDRRRTSGDALTGAACDPPAARRACSCGELDGERACDEEEGWSSCSCDDGSPVPGTFCDDRPDMPNCSCSDGSISSMYCDIDTNEWSDCECFDTNNNSPRVCDDGAVEDCGNACPGDGMGERICEDGAWTSCRCLEDNECSAGQTDGCVCDDGSEGLRRCAEGSWGRCADCSGTGTNNSNNSGTCAPPSVCRSYASVMEECFDTGTNWLSECMNHFDICDIGGNGCGASTPSQISCVVREGCEYAAAGCLDDPC